MAHRSFALIAAALVLTAGDARASYTVDLIWADTGTPTVTVTPASANTSPSGTACGDGLISTAGPGRCLLVRFTAVAQFTSSFSSLGWNSASSGVVLEHLSSRSFGQFGGNGSSSWTPSRTGPVDPSGCAGCDVAYGSFGGLSVAAIPAGVYVVGSLNLDLSAVQLGSHSFTHYLRSVIPDGVTDGKLMSAPVQVNGATLNVVPEPSTASLIGVGGVGLLALARRRRSRP